MTPPRVSVVVPTYQRFQACADAVTSALEQRPPPIEVLVCDDDSTDETKTEFERWAGREPRLRYVRLGRHAGRPAPARNLGIRAARGDWVAFLDDDDRWLPGKLAVQHPFLADDRYDVVATDAERSSGGYYFGIEGGSWEPDRAAVVAANPIITSTAVARRELLLQVGGFPEQRWLTGIEDYGLWLRLADRGARFLVLEAPLIRYEDSRAERLSSAAARRQLAVARLSWGRWVRAPGERALANAAVANTTALLHIGRQLLRDR